MNEEILLWMNKTYPEGFFCADLRAGISKIPFEALGMLAVPLLLHMNFSQLQDFVSRLIEQGVSPNTSCRILETDISASLSNLLLKSRPLRLTDLFLVVGD
jgi:hypothetical protein